VFPGHFVVVFAELALSGTYFFWRGFGKESTLYLNFTHVLEVEGVARRNYAYVTAPKPGPDAQITQDREGSSENASSVAKEGDRGKHFRKASSIFPGAAPTDLHG
jgi:hypothetical protein